MWGLKPGESQNFSPPKNITLVVPIFIPITNHHPPFEQLNIFNLFTYKINSLQTISQKGP